MLFDWLAGLVDSHELAWDCATGSGQAALELARHFDNVVATDASAAQLEAAFADPRVHYHVATAEAPALADSCADLVTVGQALHWFDRERFFASLAGIVRDGGVFAAWCYELCTVTPDVDAVVRYLYDDIVGEYWPPERALIERGYRDIKLPGSEIRAPHFEMRLSWHVDDMLGYLETWSASSRYAAANGEDPVAKIETRMKTAWGSERREVRWPLTIRACRL